MARPPAGSTSAARSTAAVLGLVAARHAGKTGSARERFLAQAKIRVDRTGANRALKLRRRPSDGDSRTTARPAGLPAAERDWLWDSYELDTFKLGLDLCVAWLPAPDTRRDQRDLLARLRRVPGVTRIYDCYGDHALVLCLTFGPQDKASLERRLRDLAPELHWAEVRAEDHQMPVKSFRRLAVQAAKAEGRHTR